MPCELTARRRERMRTGHLVLALCVLLVCGAASALGADTIYSFPFDASPPDGEGWTMTGEWEYGEPQGLGGGSSFDPAAAYTGDYVYGYDLSSNGVYENDLPASPLTTTALDCTGFVNVGLRFQRWLGVESATWDHASIEVSNDGGSWTTVWDHVSGSFTDASWTEVEYDISAVADGQPTVYIRWVMGPTDSSVTYCGWNIDDVEILGDPATEILAWIPYTDMAPGAEYENTFTALDTFYPYYNVTNSVADDATTLANELVGKDVFLAVEQENATSAQLEGLGAEFSDVLREFVESGGTVVVLLECAWNEEGFLNATGLMSSSYATIGMSGTLTVLDPSHPLVFGLGDTLDAQNAYASYVLGPEATPLVEDAAGDPVLAVRQLGAGAIVLLGFDYFEYSSDTARLLANAVQYPSATGDILLFDHPEDGYHDNHIAQQALDALGLPYRTGSSDDFDTWLTSKYWGLVVVDAPGAQPAAGFGELVNFLNAGGRAAVSTWRLTIQPDLCAAFGVSAEETFETPQPIYRWEPSHDLFTYPMDVPDLTTWYDIWTADADRLSWVSGSAELVAGYTESPAGGEIALIIADGIRILNAFLWDASGTDVDIQDGDSDGVDDCVELVMNEVEFLRPGPRADFSADDTVVAEGQVIAFTDESAGAPVAWLWDFGDGEYSVDQDPTHAYAATGTYTVTLTASDPYGQDTVTKAGYIAVGVGAEAAFSADPTTGIAGMTVDFTDESTGGVTSWEWDFGDGASATTQDPSHQYDDPGIYDVSLTATGTYSSDTETKEAHIWVGFPDVGPSYWAFEQVLLCVDAEIVGGYGDGTYQPEVVVSRDTMAVFIARALCKGDDSVPDGPAEATFDDVPTDHWAYKYVEYCVANDIVEGYDPVTYGPTVAVTRDQMAVFISRAVAGGDGSVPDGPAVATFDDVPTDYWAYKYVEYCVAENIVQGYDPVTYGPIVPVTRDQMAVFIARAFGLPV
jgi:PKD repeat protein